MPVEPSSPAAEACEVILAGACVVRTIMEKLGKGQFHRQRSRSASRRAGRAFRRLNVALLAMRKVLAIEPNGFAECSEGMSS